MNAYAEVDPAGWRHGRICFGQGLLRSHSALHGIYGATKLRKDAVARRVRYAAPMLPDHPIEDRAPLSEPLERADLIGTHEAAVALHVCREDSHKPTGDVRKV